MRAQAKFRLTGAPARGWLRHLTVCLRRTYLLVEGLPEAASGGGGGQLAVLLPRILPSQGVPQPATGVGAQT